MLKQKELQELI